MILTVRLWVGIAIWVAVLIIAIIVEINTAQLVSIWFGAGALAALVLAAFQVDEWIQLLVFAITSLILIFFTRPLAKKLGRQKKTETVAAESLIGETVMVTRDIPVDGTGEIKSKFEYYSAIASEPISKGEKVKILSIEGNKVIVEKEKEDEQ